MLYADPQLLDVLVKHKTYTYVFDHEVLQFTGEAQAEMTEDLGKVSVSLKDDRQTTDSLHKLLKAAAATNERR